MSDVLHAGRLSPVGRNLRLLLGTLFCLSVADALLTRFIISNRLGYEGNVWLAGLASTDALIGIKMLGTALAGFLLWRLHYSMPKPVMGVTVTFVAFYTLVVFWNITVTLIGSR